MAEDKMTILVVDDSRSINVFVSDILSKSFDKIEVIATSNAEDALKISLSRPLSLVISDWNMPHMSGHDLLVKLRENERTKALPVLMLTANGNPDSVHSAVELGISGYLLKPFTPDVLIARVSKILSVKPVKH